MLIVSTKYYEHDLFWLKKGKYRANRTPWSYSISCPSVKIDKNLLQNCQNYRLLLIRLVTSWAFLYFWSSRQPLSYFIVHSIWPRGRHSTQFEIKQYIFSTVYPRSLSIFIIFLLNKNGKDFCIRLPAAVCIFLFLYVWIFFYRFLFVWLFLFCIVYILYFPEVFSIFMCQIAI